MSERRKYFVFIIVLLFVLSLVAMGWIFLAPDKNKIDDVSVSQGQTDTQIYQPTEDTFHSATDGTENVNKETTGETTENETENPEKPTDSDPETGEEEIIPPPDEVPPVVEIPSENETHGLQFPSEVPGHNLRIEKLAPYSGIFVEDGTNRQVADVAMLLVYNCGDSPVEYTEITVQYQEKSLVFQITALPAGERMVVQEKTGSAVPEGVATSASALVIHRAQMSIAPEISVTDNGNNSLTVRNLTNETIPSLRVFYKYFMEQEDLFVGGIAFTVHISRLGPNGSIVVYPSHYNSQTSRVVMALVYDTET